MLHHYTKCNRLFLSHHNFLVSPPLSLSYPHPLTRSISGWKSSFLLASLVRLPPPVNTSGCWGLSGCSTSEQRWRLCVAALLCNLAAGCESLLHDHGQCHRSGSCSSRCVCMSISCKVLDLDIWWIWNTVWTNTQDYFTSLNLTLMTTTNVVFNIMSFRARIQTLHTGCDPLTKFWSDQNKNQKSWTKRYVMLPFEAWHCK